MSKFVNEIKSRPWVSILYLICGIIVGILLSWAVHTYF